MKLFNKLLLLALVLALASPFILKKPDGTPILEISKFLEPTKDLTSSVLPSAAPKSLYRWQDAKGNWQYSDHPPQDAHAQQIQVEDKINSMKTIDLPEGYKDKPKESERFDPTDGSGSSFPLTTAPIEKVPEMLDQIKDFQKNLDSRQQQLDQINR
ncbi:DUF4124 domain-containing protein [Bermanella sp. WJH001]|uniref:DUF4124 domain-containing protein n=1 Tax=Bermanella sp. WJH001 TaxID=3048005 RepID=UPI0024BD9DAA|nr:DUF4124 domain-containing protein [Bermanella sp. WJH001]MDJ1538715.1 DUF4124 domain-containing protein [Bermanella sp. WJH001]